MLRLEATAFSHRDASYLSHPVAAWPNRPTASG